ncbi:hypothetical protein ACSBR2_022745 [Camellia fascicularis]
MSRSFCLPLLLISSLLLLSLSPGFGRKLMQTFDNQESSASTVVLEENVGLSREMIELDYVYAGPNTNTKSGYIPPSPPPQS